MFKYKPEVYTQNDDKKHCYTSEEDTANDDIFCTCNTHNRKHASYTWSCIAIKYLAASNI